MQQLTKKERQLTRKYIANKSSDLPFYKCYASADWFSGHELVSVYVSKKMHSGKICCCVYLIDKGCLGLKSTLYFINMDANEYEDFVDENFMREGREYEQINEETAHNLIFGGIDHAASCGFDPMDKDWAITQRFLDEDLITDGIDEIEFGKDGKPIYLTGPYDDIKKNLRVLTNNLGEDGFTYVAPPF
ncbi:hypothetical protein [Microscilla marina]|uniref:Uncharacterized protein n=1 Tax=Microscilla marina ATCC 23134 TaxID=313606 RepID=A1ZGF1_MICM2|nr:hypothetical protein [Microscilla marina]EAY30568.1 hypothetical protein M23134_03206 [Microscilla marina ATCC 23134]